MAPANENRPASTPGVMPRTLRPVAARLLVVLLAALPMAACATRGTDFDVDRVPMIQQGVTTQEDIRRWFGEPNTVRSRGSGISAWTYTYQETETHDTETLVRIGEFIASLFGQRVVTPPLGVAYEQETEHELLVFFDREGVVSEYEYTRRHMPSRRVR
ncbi:MAG: outer membrane protein assembly factor BamE [Deltaproteobacteria bacterium]|nr:outer membrane protein assembly factor BamE [Deltaproteobacteria bacterium]